MLNPNCRESSLNHIIVMCVRKCLILQKKRGVVVAGNFFFMYGLLDEGVTVCAKYSAKKVYLICFTCKVIW